MAIYEVSLFVSCILLSLEQRNIFNLFLYCTLGELLVSVLKKLKVHIVIKLKNHRNSLLFGYYKLRFCCLEVNLFSHCFDLKDLNPNKRFEPLRKDLLFT